MQANTLNNTITKIDQSFLSNIPFRKDETLQNGEEILFRTQDLTRAMALGNLFKETVRIQFQNESGELMETEAIIWSVTEKNVLLKGGLMIPIHSITRVLV